jgi:hypothetical protein
MLSPWELSGHIFRSELLTRRPRETLRCQFCTEPWCFTCVHNSLLFRTRRNFFLFSFGSQDKPSCSFCTVNVSFLLSFSVLIFPHGRRHCLVDTALINALFTVLNFIYFSQHNPRQYKCVVVMIIMRLLWNYWIPYMTFTTLAEFAKPLGTTHTKGWGKMYGIMGMNCFNLL